MNRRRIAIVAAVLAVVAMGTHRPIADIRIVTHDAGDRQPQRVQAAVDLGVIAVRLLYTWTAHQLR